MIAVVDACTVLNLLQTVLEEKYILHLQGLFEELVVHPTVFGEIQKNKHKNLGNDEDRSIIDDLIKAHIVKYVNREVPYSEDFKICCDILKKATKHLDTEEGEYLSTALALYLRGRIENDAFNTNVLQVYFISDDIRAKDEFNYFFRINQIGQIIDSIDILTICYLKNYIPKKELSDFCLSLKAIYNRETEPLINKIKQIQEIEREDVQIQQILSKMIELIYKSEISKLDQLRGDRIFKKLCKKERSVETLLEQFIKANPQKRIEYIEKRRREIEDDYIWQI